MKINWFTTGLLVTLAFLNIEDAQASTKFDQDYSAFQKLFEGNKSCASLVAVYDQLDPAVKVLNEGAYRCHIVFSINGEMKEPITDLYVKSLIHLYPGQGKDVFGPYKREDVFAPAKLGKIRLSTSLEDKISINICLKDCSQADLTKNDSTYYQFIMTILSAGDAMLWYGDSEIVKSFFEKSFGQNIVEDWTEVETGYKSVVVTKEMLSNIPDGGKANLKEVIDVYKKRVDEFKQRLGTSK